MPSGSLNSQKSTAPSYRCNRTDLEAASGQIRLQSADVIHADVDSGSVDPCTRRSLSELQPERAEIELHQPIGMDDIWLTEAERPAIQATARRSAAHGVCGERAASLPCP